MTQLEQTRASVVMNINESHYSAIPWDKGEGSHGVLGGPAQGCDVVRLWTRSARWRIVERDARGRADQIGQL